MKIQTQTNASKDWRLMKSRIIGTGSSCPEYVMTNDMLSQLVDTNDEWIRTRTGICRRHIADRNDDAACLKLAAEASHKALVRAGTNAEDIDMILFATSTPDSVYPNMASLLQRELGAVNAAGYDINAACSGFIYALSAADAFIRAGMAEKILLVGAEIMSRHVDWNDRSTCVLFGDGAGAVVVAPDDKYGIEALSLHNDGNAGDALSCSTSGHIAMNGQEVFRFAVRRVPEVIEEVLGKCGWSKEDADLYVLHQANIRIIQSAARRLDIDIDRFAVNLDEYGNTSAASIPLLLAQLDEEGRLEQGKRIVCSGFGAGLSWGAAALTW